MARLGRFVQSLVVFRGTVGYFWMRVVVFVLGRKSRLRTRTKESQHENIWILGNWRGRVAGLFVEIFETSVVIAGRLGFGMYVKQVCK